MNVFQAPGFRHDFVVVGPLGTIRENTEVVRHGPSEKEGKEEDESELDHKGGGGEAGWCLSSLSVLLSHNGSEDSLAVFPLLVRNGVRLLFLVRRARHRDGWEDRVHEIDERRFPLSSLYQRSATPGKSSKAHTLQSIRLVSCRGKLQPSFSTRAVDKLN